MINCSNLISHMQSLLPGQIGESGQSVGRSSGIASATFLKLMPATVVQPRQPLAPQSLSTSPPCQPHSSTLSSPTPTRPAMSPAATQTPHSRTQPVARKPVVQGNVRRSRHLYAPLASVPMTPAPVTLISTLLILSIRKQGCRRQLGQGAISNGATTVNINVG